MSDQRKADLGGVVIDAPAFARNGERLVGEVAVAALARLEEYLADAGGRLTVDLAGETDDEGNPGLRLRIGGSLNLLCQRCLEAMTAPVAIDNHLRLADGPAESAAGIEVELDAAEPDTVAADRQLALLPLVEEEVLLSLPIAPRHERCLTPDGGVKDRAPSPFAVLAQMKKH